MSRILLVEDSKVQALLAKGILEAAGHTVVHVATAEEAVKACYDSPPDIVLQDQHLVETSGLEVCRRIKSDIALANIPVLVLTAGDKEKDHIAAFDAGADAFLPKGSPNAELLAIIAKQARPSSDVESIDGGDAAADRSRPARILAVDDSPTFREVVCRKLTEVGFEVVGVASGSEALASLADQAFDIAVVDVVMPEMDGFEFCRQARQWADENNRHLGLLVMTGSDREDVLVEALESGADDYVTKHHEIDVLIAHATALARRIARIKRLESLNGRTTNQQATTASKHAQTEILSNFSREIRVPVNRILEMAEQLTGSTLTPEQQDHLQTIRQSAAELLNRLDKVSE